MPVQLAFESTIRPTEKGTPVPYHHGLKIFSTNRPCSVCGRGGNFEQDGVRYDRFCWRAEFHK